jgi:hypothetical protein
LLHETGSRALRTGIVPNRFPLTVNSPVHRGNVGSQKSGGGRQLHKQRDTRRPTGRSNARVSVSSVSVNWAGLVALWALPYLTLLDHLRVDAARSEILQWSLLIVGVLGLVSILYTAWRETLDPAWRARHRFTLRKPPGRPHTGNIA